MVPRACKVSCMLSHFSHVQLSAIPWTVDHQAPLSIEFSRQEYWSGLPCPPPGDRPCPGTEAVSLMSPALPGELFITSTTWEAQTSRIRVSGVRFALGLNRALR